MNQAIAINWIVFSLCLVNAMFFGIFYALFVRWISIKQVDGQTAYLVVGGVGVVLLLTIPLIGLINALVVFALFGAAGLPMVIEYVDRVHQEYRRDLQHAESLAREVVKNDNETPTG